MSALPTSMTVPQFKGHGIIDFAEIPVPTPGPGQLVIQVKANALCGSERGQFTKGTSILPGHETAGVVVAAGAETQTLTGTPGVVYAVDFCGECRSCKLGYTNQCLHKRGVLGFTQNGGYGPYELVPERIFFPVDASLTLTEATLLLDIMGTNSHALHRAQRLHPDIQSIVVAGAGPIGLGMVAMAKLTFGADFPIVVFDIIAWRLALAEGLGGLPVDLNRMSLDEGLQAHGLSAVDLAVDTSGKGAARQAALAVLANRGVLLCIGHGEGLNLNVVPDLIATERAILGSDYFSYNELPENLARLREHRAYLSQIITHRFGVSEIQKAFETFFGGETGKVVVEQ